MMAGCGFFDLAIQGRAAMRRGRRRRSTRCCGAQVIAAWQSIVGRNIAPATPR